MLNNSLINKGETVAVALSGGKDSMFLLHNLLLIKDELQLNIKAVNVDHSIRGEESISDSEFVKTYCQKLGVPLFFKKVDAVNYSKNKKLSLEQGARELRYGVFKEAVDSGFCNKIATAHHADDNFESVLFNLFRGSGISGICGIKESVGNIIRPILHVEKSEIDDFIVKNNIPYVTDSTNFDDDYTRNFIRLNLTPLIKEKFAGAVNSVNRLTKTAKKEDEFLNLCAENAVDKKGENYFLPVSLNEAIFNRATVIILKKCGLVKDYEKVHIDSVYNLTRLKNGSEVVLPKNIIAVKEYNSVVFYTQISKKCDSVYSFDLGTFDFITSTANVIIGNSNKSGLIVDANAIPKTAVIRTRRNGDTFKKFGGGTKKLKDYFIDKKIPKYYRDCIPLIANGSEILAIFGVEISSSVKTTKNTTNFLTLTLTPKKEQ